MTEVNTREGIFGAGGYGGGVFDGAQMGFGGMGQFEQAAAGIGAIVWKGAPDPLITKLQVALNRELVGRGMRAIGTDGVVGPGTCGAIAWLGAQKSVNYAANPDLQIIAQVGAAGNVCQTATYPTTASGTQYKPPNTFHNDLPWGADSATTLKLQHDLNNDLQGHGYLPLDETGQLDAPTCGAMKLATDAWGMDYLGEYGGNCQAFSAPQLKPAPAPPPVHVQPAPAPEPVPMLRPQKAAMGGWVVGGLLAAAVVAGVAATRKKRH